MANTYVDSIATASQTDFAFSFSYLKAEHVKVEINGVDTAAFTLVTSPSNKVVLNSGATAGQVVRVRRNSQPDTNLVDFVNGSVLTETELDFAYQHNRFLNEELAELNEASLQIGPGGTDWDAKSNKILNVSTPTLTADAATKNYVDQKVEQIAAGASTPPSKWQFTGTAGANTTYTVTGADVLGDSAYDVSVNGLVKEPTVDYTVDPDTDTLTIIPSLAGGEDIVIIQRGLGIPLTQGTIGTAQIADAAVTNAKLATPYSHPNHTGDVTSTGDGATAISTDAVTTTKILDGAVTSAKISSTDTTFNVGTNVAIGAVAGGTFKFDVTGSTGNVANFQSDNAGGSTALFVRNKSATGTAAILQLVARTGGTDLARSLNMDLNATGGYLQLSFAEGDQCAFRFDNSNIGDLNAGTGAFFPKTNGSHDIGKTGSRWNNLWSAGTFNGSDVNLKEDIEELSEAEKRVAIACKSLVKKYKFKDAKAKKGDNARIHVGVIAQELKSAFEAEGLDAFKYSMVGEDTWYEKIIEGEKVVKYEPTEGYTEVTQMSVNYTELLAFIISAL